MQASRLYRFSLIVLCLILLHGCGQLPERPDRVSADPDAARAAALAEQGQYLAAAALYQQLALRTPDPATQTAFILASGEAAAKGGDWDGARQAAAELGGRAMSDQQNVRYRLLTGGLLLKEMRPLDALAALGDSPPANTPTALLIQYHRAVAQSYRQMGNLLESANALQQVDRLLKDPTAKLENQIDILRSLALLNEQALEGLQPSPPGVMGGWMQLALLVKRHGTDPDQLAPVLASWRGRFPNHPALPALLTDYADQLRGQFQPVSRIAVLLPQSGSLAAVSAAIRDGMMVTQLKSGASQRPEIRFYDSTDPATIWPLYSQAVADGAELVIGPLQKQAVDQLARAGELPAPVLALNEVALTMAPPENLFMYSLSPEDEARQAAERAWIDGKRRPVVFVPSGAWGDRIASAFEGRWRSLGGSLAGIGRYDSESHDYTAAITSALHLDRSEARHAQMQKWLGRRLEFEPRRRQDVDAVFMAARPVQAQGLRPQLMFHRASDLPIYATSHAWLGQLTRGQVEDMRGILLPDIPWLVQPQTAAGSRADVARYLPKSGSAYGRLYAMGMDALTLAPHLNRLRSSRFESLDGNTGNLYMDENQRVRRQLVWIRLDETPEILGFAPRLDLQATPVEIAPVDNPGTTLSPAS